jgi:hypothetical protein
MPDDDDNTQQQPPGDPPVDDLADDQCEPNDLDFCKYCGRDLRV